MLTFFHLIHVLYYLPLLQSPKAAQPYTNMPPNSLFPTQSPLGQFEKWNQTGTNGGNNSSGSAWIAIGGFVIAALTLLGGFVPYLHKRLRRPPSSPAPSRFANARLPPTFFH